MSGYAVVQFLDWDDGQSSLAVPVSWIFASDGRLGCYFPKSCAQKAIRKQYKPHADWDVFTVRRLSRRNIVTYDKALQKEREAINTSGIDSTDAESAKRKRKRPARFSVSPDVSPDASECGEYSGFNNVHTCSVRIMLLSQLCELSVESVNSNAYLYCIFTARCVS